jgi:hypothetical protein
MKTNVGQAASVHSIFANAYASLAIDAPNPEESEYWAVEASGVWPKARAHADGALAALAPPPPSAPTAGDGEEGAEGAEAGEGGWQGGFGVVLPHSWAA